MEPHHANRAVPVPILVEKGEKPADRPVHAPINYEVTLLARAYEVVGRGYLVCAVAQVSSWH